MAPVHPSTINFFDDAPLNDTYIDSSTYYGNDRYTRARTYSSVNSTHLPAHTEFRAHQVSLSRRISTAIIQNDVPSSIRTTFVAHAGCRMTKSLLQVPGAFSSTSMRPFGLCWSKRTPMAIFKSASLTQDQRSCPLELRPAMASRVLTSVSVVCLLWHVGGKLIPF